MNARMEKIRDRIEARQRAAALRAGAIQATILNATPGVKRRYRATDFVQSGPKDLTPDQVREHLLGWARAVNQRQEH